jgi:ribonuclease J
MKLMINLVKPRFLVPLHGELRHLKLHAEMGVKLGIPEDRVAVIENGTPIDFTPYGMTIGDRLPGGYVFVDGSVAGDIGWAEVRDRDRLSQAGVFFAVVRTNGRGDLEGKPDMITRGLINDKEAEPLLEGVRDTLARVVRETEGQGQKLSKNQLEQAISRYIYDEIRKRPVIEVVIA